MASCPVSKDHAHIQNTQPIRTCNTPGLAAVCALSFCCTGLPHTARARQGTLASPVVQNRISYQHTSIRHKFYLIYNRRTSRAERVENNSEKGRLRKDTSAVATSPRHSHCKYAFKLKDAMGSALDRKQIKIQPASWNHRRV